MDADSVSADSVFADSVSADSVSADSVSADANMFAMAYASGLDHLICMASSGEGDYPIRFMVRHAAPGAQGGFWRLRCPAFDTRRTPPGSSLACARQQDVEPIVLVQDMEEGCVHALAWMASELRHTGYMVSPGTLGKVGTVAANGMQGAVLEWGKAPMFHQVHLYLLDESTGVWHAQRVLDGGLAFPQALAFSVDGRRVAVSNDASWQLLDFDLVDREAAPIEHPLKPGKLASCACGVGPDTWIVGYTHSARLCVTPKRDSVRLQRVSMATVHEARSVVVVFVHSAVWVLDGSGCVRALNLHD